LFGGQAVNIGLALFDQLHGVVVKLLEIIRRVVQFRPFKAQPLYIAFDRFHIFVAFFLGVGIVKTQIAGAVIFGGDTKIQADRFCMTDMQITVRFRRKACDNFTVVFVVFEIVGNDLADKV